MNGELRDRIEELTLRRVEGSPHVFTDTTEFMRIERDDVLDIDGLHYLVLANAVEGRFGIDDEPKYWVKIAIELESGRKKIIKLVFHEEFTSRVGPLTIRCVRSEEKEGQVLDLVRGRSGFMQGRTALDDSGNLVRIIDFIPGRSLYATLGNSDVPHERYFQETFPDLLLRVRGAVAGIGFLHRSGTHHGDVRNDHLLIDSTSGELRWIDFDLTQELLDYDIFCMGHVLAMCAAKGILTFQDALKIRPGAASELSQADASILFANRVMNIAPVYPYVPRSLNDILRRFSSGSSDHYESIEELIGDLDGFLREIGRDPAGSPVPGGSR